MSETVKVIVTLSKGQYENLKDMQFGSIGSKMIFNAVKNGTPLPEGHGRLGDLDELEQRISNFVEYDAKINDEHTVIRERFIVDGIRQTPTIIEADVEGEIKPNEHK